MKFLVTQHPDAPLVSKTLTVEADLFTRDAQGITFLSNTNPNPDAGNPGVTPATGRHEVAWFRQLAAVQIASEEESETPTPKK